MIKHLLQYSFVAAVVLAAAFNSFGTEAIFSKNSPLSFLNAIIANEVTLSADSVAGMPSIEVVVPVRVKGFSNMITGQGTLSFDPAVVSFVGIEQYGLPGMGASNFGTTQATKGKVFFSWDDATLAGRTLADNAVVFAVRFKVIGKYGESSNVSFVNTPVPLEFVDKDFASADLALVAGKVQVPAYSITTSALNSNNLCVGSTVSVSFTKEGNYDAANTFTAQLSDASGSFTTPTVIGTGKDSPITATIPASATAGTGYRIRVISSSPAITGSNNGSDITIVSLSEASSVSIVSSSAANKSIYDGVYEVNGSFVDSFNSSFLGKYPKVIELRTIDENSVYYFDQEYELDGHIFQASTGLTYYGNWQAIFNFGTTHTIESVINNYGQPSGNSRRSGRIDSKGINKATFESNGLPKTIEVSYIMLQNDVDRSFFTETYSYKGPTSCAATYTLQAAGAPVGGTYRWYKSSIGGEAIYESAEPNYVTSPIYSSNSPQYFYVSIVNSNGCEGPRKSIEVVYAPDVVKPTATAAERCGTGTLTLTASGAPAGSSYSWYTSATGGTPISGVSTASFTTPALTATTTYYVATKNSTGCESERVAVVATIVPDIVANTVSADQTICSGSRPVELKGSLPTGGNGTYAYQWEQSTDGTTFSTITGATSQHYTPETLTATTWYRRKVAAGTTCSESISSAVKVTVSPLPASPVVTNANICSGASTTLNVSTPVAGYSYKWYSAATGGTALTAGSSYTTPVLTATTIYYVESVSAAGCVSSRTAVTVTINPIPTKPTVTAAARCGEGSVTLEAAGAPTGANYRWYTTATGGTPILGATTAFYATPNLSATTTYYVSVMSSSSCESPRTAVTATINTIPTAPTVTAASRCGAGRVTLLASGATTGESYRWYTTATGGTAISGATTASYTTPSLNATTSYYVSVINNTNCESARTSVTATIKEIPATPVATAAPVQVGGALSLSASTISGATYSWAGPGGFTSSQQYPSITKAALSNSGTYSVIASVNGCSSEAGSVEVNVVDVPPITFDADSVSGLAGSEIIIPIRVQGFTDIVSMQYSLNWDSKVATFVGVEDFGLTGLTAANIGTTQAATGKVMLSWSDENADAFTLAYSTVLFNLRLKLVGVMGQSTPITITGTPTAMEVSEKTGFIVPVKTQAGAATVRKLIKISGKIKSEQGEGIRTVTLTATGGENPLPYETKPDGLYEFDVMQNGTYSISAFKANDSTVYNGITTLDIALIRRHILAITALGSPYKLLAADVDHSNTITTTDIATIRKVVLTIDDAFPGKRLWKFVPQSFTFSDPANPFPFTDSVQVHTNIVNEQAGQDFIGVKLGDVNNTWDANTARQASAGSLAVTLQDQQVLPGTEVVVPVKVYDFNKVNGYQFTLNWDPTVLEYLTIENAATQGAFGTHKVSQGRLTTTWDDAQGASQSLAEGSVLFYVKFKAVGKLNTETQVAITSDLTRSVAYNYNLQQLNVKPTNAKVQIKSSVAPLVTGYVLQQNAPNPFSQNGTNIRFSIPQQEQVTINIYNTLGQLVRSYKAIYAAGDHELIWDGRNSKGQKLSQGTYIYRMEAGKFSEAKRAIII